MIAAPKKLLVNVFWPVVLETDSDVQSGPWKYMLLYVVESPLAIIWPHHLLATLKYLNIWL